MRQYLPIWTRIKVHKKATIVAPANVHKRIIQAVRKERAMDVAYRNYLNSSGITIKLYIESNKSKCLIYFNLEIVSIITTDDV